jgi:hypothetical protein
MSTFARFTRSGPFLQVLIASPSAHDSDDEDSLIGPTIFAAWG